MSLYDRGMVVYLYFVLHHARLNLFIPPPLPIATLLKKWKQTTD